MGYNLLMAACLYILLLADWFHLTGLLHDVGKVLALWGEPQWAVVGDTFPVGCALSNKIVFSEFCEQNPDSKHPVYRYVCVHVRVLAYQFMHICGTVIACSYVVQN